MYLHNKCIYKHFYESASSLNSVLFWVVFPVLRLVNLCRGIIRLSVWVSAALAAACTFTYMHV